MMKGAALKVCGIIQREPMLSGKQEGCVPCFARSRLVYLNGQDLERRKVLLGLK